MRQLGIYLPDLSLSAGLEAFEQETLGLEGLFDLFRKKLNPEDRIGPRLERNFPDYTAISQTLNNKYKNAQWLAQQSYRETVSADHILRYLVGSPHRPIDIDSAFGQYQTILKAEQQRLGQGYRQYTRQFDDINRLLRQKQLTGDNDTLLRKHLDRVKPAEHFVGESLRGNFPGDHSYSESTQKLTLPKVDDRRLTLPGLDASGVEATAKVCNHLIYQPRNVIMAVGEQSQIGVMHRLYDDIDMPDEWRLLLKPYYATDPVANDPRLLTLQRTGNELLLALGRYIDRSIR